MKTNKTNAPGRLSNRIAAVGALLAALAIAMPIAPGLESTPTTQAAPVAPATSLHQFVTAAECTSPVGLAQCAVVWALWIPVATVNCPLGWNCTTCAADGPLNCETTCFCDFAPSVAKT